MGREELSSSLGYAATGHMQMVQNGVKGGLDCTIGIISLLRE